MTPDDAPPMPRGYGRCSGCHLMKHVDDDSRVFPHNAYPNGRTRPVCCAGSGELADRVPVSALDGPR